MKRIVLLLSLLFLSVFAIAAETVRLGNGDNTVSVLSSTQSETTLQYQITNFNKTSIDLNGSEWWQIYLPKEGITLDKGDPELPVFNRSIAIDDRAKMKLEISEVSYQDFQMKVVPSKGNLTRNIDPATVPYTFGKTYQLDQFFPEKLADLSEPFIMRDIRGVTVKTTPFAYNPVTGVLRVFTSYRIKVTNDGIDNVNTFLRTKNTVSRAFQPIYERRFINWQSSRYTAVDASFGKLLVICPTSYLTVIAPYVNWKKQKGIPTELVEWSTIGTTAAQLQTYIQTRFNADNDITYIQIVGDAAQVPTIMYDSSGGSDPTFALVAGSDNYPDIFIGRFSAESTTDVTTQVNKTITYERDLTSSATWCQMGFGIGSSSGPGDDGEYDYAHIDNIRTDLVNYGYTTVDQIYYDTSTAAQVSTAVNAGRGFANYCGHGADTYWVTTGFSNTNVNALTNGNMTPFIMDVACVNGNFVSMTCFAEAWLRKSGGGAVGIYASSINQTWNPPMIAQDEVTDLLVAQSQTTLGGLYYNGSCKMLEESSDVAMYKTWHIFGDASLLARSKTPIAMSVTHPANIVTGTTSVSVSTGVSNALVSITYNNIIYGRGFTNTSGNVTVTLTSPPSGAVNYTITTTAYNRVTYVGTIAQTVATGPWMEVTAANYADSNNNTPEYNEAGTLNVTFHNSGVQAATAVTATLTCSTTGITITDNTEYITSLAADASSTINGAFAFNIANNMVNSTVANFTITMVGSSTWTYNFSKTINAPVLAFGSMTISDPSPGNGNGRLDPGETVTVTMPLNNTGAAASPSGNSTLTCVTSGITVNTGTANFSSIAASGTTSLTFSVTASSGITIGTVAAFVFNATAGAYTATKTENVAVGLIKEDFSTGNFNAYPWVMGTTPWTIDSSTYYSAGYAAKSGTITASGSTTMQTTRVLSTSGTLTFYYKVSSESGYDYLKFYVDGTVQNSWSGTVDWTQASFTLAAGTRVLKWEYMKDGSVDTGSDCAWVDDIVFPASTAPSVYNPPQNLNAVGGNGYVTLTWTAPASGTPTGYKIYKNSSLLTTVTGLTYTDTAVVNNTTYSYYLIATYSGGQSDPTNTVSATPGTTTFVIIGTGTSSNTTSTACPINVYYQSMHGQSVYLASELTAQGITGPLNITQIGFNVTGLPTLAMPSFVVRMGLTTATNSASFVAASGLTTVYSATSYQPSTTGWNMLTLSTPFVWNGTSNIVVDTAYGLIGSYTSSGTTTYTSVTSGYIFLRSDTVNETTVFTGGTTSTYRPNVKLGLVTTQTGPNISVNPTSVSSTVYVTETATPTLTIYNTGTTSLNWSTGATISTWGNVSTTSGSIAAGGNTVLTLTLNSAGLAAGTYNSTMTITSNATNSPTLNVPVTFIVQPSPYPTGPRYVAEWEPATGVIIAYASGFGLPYTAIADLSTRAHVYVVVTSANQSTASSLLSSNGVTMSNVSYINPTGVNTYWTRDYGPWYVFDQAGNLSIVDFTYNRVRPFDDVLNQQLDDTFGLGYYSLPLVATGGNVMTDGTGKMMSTNLILSENDGVQTAQVTEYNYTQAQINTLVHNYLGVNEYQFYTDPLANSSIDHIDCWGKLLDVDKVIIARVPSTHSNYAAIEAAVAQWQSKVSSYGTPYQIFRVDQSSNNEPYTNSFIYNNKIYVPQWNSTPSSYDTAAIAVYQAAMPGYTVQGYYNSSWLSDDAFHCRVNSLFDSQMIHTNHIPPTSAQAQSTVTITAEITHHNALTTAGTYIAYKHTSTGTWQTVSLGNTTGNTWTANVPTPALGQTLYYYILATDNTSRTCVLPLCGANDPFELIVNIPAPNHAPTIVLPDTISFDQDTSLPVNFDPYVDDIDNNPLTLGYSGNTNITVQITGLNVAFSAPAGWVGTETITFTVSDGTLQATDSVPVTVNLVQLPPPDPEVIIVDLGDGTISWPPVPNALSYEIWACDEPYGTYEIVAVTTNPNWQDDFSGHDCRFYKVIATNQPVTGKH
jgi:agmatine/peptidylarginine deiminase